MKVLALASYPVDAASTRYRVAQFVAPLTKQGIDLTIYPFLSAQLNASIYERSQWPRTVFGLTQATLRRFVDVWRAHNADVLFVQREAMMFGPPLIEWLAMHIGRCPMVLDLDDATYIRYLSPTYGRLASSLKWFSKTDDLIRWARIVTCGNRAIAEHVSALGKAAVIIPTVVDNELFRPASSEDKNSSGECAPVLGWVGTHSTYQYLVSILPVVQRLAGKYRFRLKVVGAGRQITVPGVELENLKWSLEREIKDFQSFDIGLYPIVEDDWSVGKSGFKAIQYMAVGVPFVMSPVGASADIGEPGRTHFLARTGDEWYQALERLLAEESLRLQMGRAGRQHSLRHYDLETQAQKLGGTLRAATDATGQASERL